ncbi:MAG TPA: phosphoribosyltransferase family protein [Polyangiaceae bacterium]|jgi:ComF family protein|nr:phosphoribosyltransferase family protein [Polyangiaceae bacterium]
MPVSSPARALRTWADALHRAARLLTELIAPDSCAACDAPVEREQLFCARCGACPPRPPAVSLSGELRCSAGGAYAPPLSTAIQRFKFSQRADLARPLARLLPWPPLELSASEARAAWSVVPVPLHYARLVERGFNPAALLGRELCQRAGARFCPELLERARFTAQQSRLPARERRANVAGAFRAQGALRGRKVVLVDDVVTTGSTLLACCRALYAAGVDRVTVIALAAAPAP